MWRTTVKAKLEILGRHGARVPVGGSAPADDDGASEDEDLLKEEKASKRDKADIEPLLFHTPPFAFYQELIHSYDAIAVIALAGDGKFAEACLEARVPFFGMTWSQEHSEALKLRLQKRAFELMLSPESKLYIPQLQALLDERATNIQQEIDNEEGGDSAAKGERSKGKGKKNKGKGKPKSKTKEKDKASDKGQEKGKGKGESDGQDLLARVREMARQAAEDPPEPNQAQK